MVSYSLSMGNAQTEQIKNGGFPMARRVWSEAVFPVRQTTIHPVGSYAGPLEQIGVAIKGKRIKLSFVRNYPNSHLYHAGATVEMPLAEWNKIVEEVARQTET